jgi:hypothetical protein
VLLDRDEFPAGTQPDTGAKPDRHMGVDLPRVARAERKD